MRRKLSWNRDVRTTVIKTYTVRHWDMGTEL
jgi:hypothetical protein